MSNCYRSDALVYVCECGDSYSEKIEPPTPHDSEFRTTLEPTCTNAGVRSYVCLEEACPFYKQPIQSSTLKPLGHTYGEGGKCIRCGAGLEVGATFTDGALTYELLTEDTVAVEDWDASDTDGNLTIPETVISPEGKAYTVTELYKFVSWRDAEELISITIPDTVTEAAEYLFDSATELVEVNGGNGLSVIPEGMFYGCESLTKVNGLSGATEIGDYAFCECTNLGKESNQIAWDNLTRIG